MQQLGKNELKSILPEIQEKLRKASEPEALAAFRKFIPGGMPVYGVRTPNLNQLAQEYKDYGLSLVELLWKIGSLEEQIIAAKILQKIARKHPEQSLKLVTQFAGFINNWAVCDALGMQALQQIRLTHQAQIFKLAAKLSNSKDLWQRRLSLVLVEYYTRYKEQHPAIMKLVTKLQKDDEYYVKKAVVWILRNMKKGK